MSRTPLSRKDWDAAAGLPAFALDPSVRLNCSPDNADIFQPEQKAGVAEIRAAAKRVCRHCHARAACLEWAVDTDQPYGIWGGLTAAERRRLHRRGYVS